MMNKTMQKLKEKMKKEYWKYRNTQDELTKRLQKYFDFEIEVLHQEADGFIICDIDTSDNFTFNILQHKKKGIKLTRNDCYDYCL